MVIFDFSKYIYKVEITTDGSFFYRELHLKQMFYLLKSSFVKIIIVVRELNDLDPHGISILTNLMFD